MPDTKLGYRIMMTICEEHGDAQKNDFIGDTRYVDGKRYVVTDAEHVWGDGEGHEGWILYLKEE